MGAANKNWNGKVLYQIYPRSFKDSNDDGIGDLKGITKKLYYLAGKPESLGVDIIWISPFYLSPMVDFGYDISDYRKVDPIFGNLKDFKELLAKAHSIGLRVMIDYVSNHTSSKHEWFKESRSSKDNKKRDWYIWKPAKKDGSPPNNWQSVFGGSAWEFDNLTGQYYLHSFHKEQPDLNWENKDVVRAMQDTLEFWLQLGVDGFRVDAISWMGKDLLFKDEKIIEKNAVRSYDSTEHKNHINNPNVYKYIKHINKVVAKYDKFAIYEFYTSQNHGENEYKNFYKNTDSIVSAPFNFSGIIQPWQKYAIKNSVDNLQSILEEDNIPVYCLGNHDQPRLATRIGVRSAKQAAVLLLTLPGIPTIYYGDELGMQDEYVADADTQDPFEINEPNQGLGRDPARAPMHWDSSDDHGFSFHRPWLKSEEAHPENSLRKEKSDPKSFYNLYKSLIHLRKNHVAISQGKYIPFNTTKNVYGFYRQLKDEVFLILINYSSASTTIHKKSIIGRMVLSTHRYYKKAVMNRIQLYPYEAVVIKIRTSGKRSGLGS